MHSTQSSTISVILDNNSFPNNIYSCHPCYQPSNSKFALAVHLLNEGGISLQSLLPLELQRGGHHAILNGEVLVQDGDSLHPLGPGNRLLIIPVNSFHDGFEDEWVALGLFDVLDFRSHFLVVERHCVRDFATPVQLAFQGDQSRKEFAIITN
jgi:hypothetical protein